MGLSQQWTSQKHSRRFRGVKDRLVIKLQESGRLRNGEQRARKGEGRKQNKEAGNQGAALAVWGSGNAFSQVFATPLAALQKLLK